MTKVLVIEDSKTQAHRLRRLLEPEPTGLTLRSPAAVA